MSAVREVRAGAKVRVKAWRRQWTMVLGISKKKKVKRRRTRNTKGLKNSYTINEKYDQRPM